MFATINTPTTVTAPAFTACLNRSVTCGTSSGTGVILGVPITIKGRLINGANAGGINISLKSEVGGNEVNITAGSYCHNIAEP